METSAQDALLSTATNVNLGADAAVQGPVASVVNSLSGEPLTGVALAQPGKYLHPCPCQLMLGSQQN